jgi:electron transport complex protein RnfG
MAQLESSFKNMVLVLSGIALFAAGTLASMYEFTKAPIAASKVAKQQNAIKEVLPAFDHLGEPVKIADGNENMVVNKAFDAKNEFVGAAVETSSNNGFAGKIVIMVGFDKEGNIFNYSVLEQKETPGLGTKMVDWFKTNKGNQSIIGKNPAIANLTVSKDGGEVDAITASTISSRAFLFSVRNAYHAFESNKDEVVASANDTILIN